MTDVVVVGSGASAVHAAWPLVEAGLQVVMLDVGRRDDTYERLIPDLPWSEIRRTDPGQHRYFLGDRFEGIPFGSVRVGAQLTPPRAFLTHSSAELAPTDSPSFQAMESLAAGGLASGWGAGTTRFTAADLAGTPITPADLEPHYRAVEERIGVCGEPDDLSRDLGDHSPMLPPLRPDTPSRLLLQRYAARRAALHRRGLRMGITRLAACTVPHRGRGPHRYDDLDFWADKNRAVYRARFTIDELSAFPNFRYIPARLVLTFREPPTGGVQIRARILDQAGGGGGDETIHARAAVLAAGVFGTARIVLRSLGLYEHPCPLVANPYTYVPCLNLAMLGREPEDARHSLSQLTATYTPPSLPGYPQLHISIYSYRSLLTFKLMKEAPLGARASLALMRALIPMLTILGIHHADSPSPRKSLTLRRDHAGGPDRLAIRYALDDDQSAAIDRSERQLLRIFRSLGCLAIKRIRPGHGSSIHYAGTFPMSASPGELRTSRDGLLSGTNSVYLADGSLLPSLPAKGLTLTLMANADRIGTRLASTLR